MGVFDDGLCFGAGFGGEVGLQAGGSLAGLLHFLLAGFAGFVENLLAGHLHISQFLLAAGVHFLALLDALAALLQLLEDGLDAEAHHDGGQDAEGNEVGDERIGVQTEISDQVLNISGKNHGCELLWLKTEIFFENGGKGKGHAVCLNGPACPRA